MVSGSKYVELNKWIEVPHYGCYKGRQTIALEQDPERVVSNIWSIGGERGWYYASWLWSVRGFLDKLVGGVGLRRGRTNTGTIHSGDALDFWRVLYADKTEPRLLLFAEMKLPRGGLAGIPYPASWRKGHPGTNRYLPSERFMGKALLVPPAPVPCFYFQGYVPSHSARD